MNKRRLEAEERARRRQQLEAGMYAVQLNGYASVNERVLSRVETCGVR